AEEALKLIEVEYEVLPHVLDVKESMAEDAPILHDNLRTDAFVCVRYHAAAAGQLPRIQFAVIDTGIGLTPDQRDKIAGFEAFSQADASTTREFGGTGLGLRIANSLAKILGGDLTIESEFRVGSAFTVTVDPGPADGVRMLTPEQIQNHRQSRRRDRQKKIEARTASLEGFKLLLAEDGPDNQRLISHVLRKAGATIDVVENGKEAVDSALSAEARGEPYDVILMDIQMPVLDGYSATRELRRNGYHRHVVALTAHAMASDRDKCLDAGCDEFATKPIDRNALIGTILAVCEDNTPA
ncbi:MAG: response regulator, partial [Planctomycetota bacterium]